MKKEVAKKPSGAYLDGKPLEDLKLKIFKSGKKKQDIAKDLGISLSYLSNCMAGRNRWPTELLTKLKEYLKEKV